MSDLIYFDHAATTPLNPRVLDAMMPYLTELYGNPSSIYFFAQKARQAIDEAREKTAAILHGKSRDVLFTSSGTESNNLFIFGVGNYALQKNLPQRHIITTKIEHDSVLKPLEQLAAHGFDITYLDVGENGVVDPRDVAAALRPDTLFVTIMYANNEIGTIQSIVEIGKIIKEAQKQGASATHTYPLFHTDACQAAAYLDLSIPRLGVDAMTLNGGKIYGPKGVGMLYIPESVPFVPQLFGGGQEYRKRSGTENVPAIVGFAKALSLVQEMREEETKRLLLLRDMLIDGILKNISDTRLNGHRDRRLPNNVNISFKGLEGEGILLQLDMLQVAASSGSACSSGSLEPSHVIRALGLSEQWTHSSTRFTLGHGSTQQQVEFVLEKLPGVIAKLRELSPFV